MDFLLIANYFAFSIIKIHTLQPALPVFESCHTIRKSCPTRFLVLQQALHMTNYNYAQDYLKKKIISRLFDYPECSLSYFHHTFLSIFFTVPKSPPRIQIDEKYNLSSTNVAEKTCFNEDSSRSNRYVHFLIQISTTRGRLSHNSV